ncbi:MAG: FHA domain-containing protein, partial [Chromatiales bacterium]|nr:FHA domain-containing protein [Chromatiales bacterium]
TGTLKLTLEGHAIACKSSGELDTLLRGRTAPSGERLAQLLSLDERGLLIARNRCDEHDAGLEHIAAAWMVGSEVSLEDKSLPPDQGWDFIMSAVARAERGQESFRFVAVERYRQYLRAARQVLDGLSRAHAMPSERPADGYGSGSMQDFAPQRLGFDLADLSGDATLNQSLERLPKGEAIKVRFGAHQSMILRFAKYEFTLVSGAQFLLIDDCGADLRLPSPHCVVGRGSGCNVMLHGRFRSMSRKHLMIDIEDDGTAYLTDISSMGTFVPASALGNSARM